MGSSTSPDSLYKPAVGEEGWGNAVNANMDTIQARLTALEAVAPEEETFLATRYVTGGDGIEKVFDLSASAAESSPAGRVTNAHYTSWTWTGQGGDSSSYLYDDPGYLQTDPYPDPDYWALTHPAGTVLLLPTGLYYWSMNITMTGTADADSRNYLAPDYAYAYRDDPDPLRAIGAYSLNGISPLTLGLSQGAGSFTQGGHILVPGTGAQPFIFYIQPQGYPSNDLLLTFVNLQVGKIR